MIERLVISNLRRAQAFDANLRSASGIEKLADKFIEQIMFNTNPQKRKSAIENLKDKIIEHVENEILPQAERIGNTNAVDIAKKLPEPFVELPARERQLALFQGKMKKADRLAILRQSIKAKSDTLDARLVQYYLEPSEGSSAKKVDRLRDIHDRLEGKRKTFEKNIKAYNAGEIKSRPSKPDLDYASAFTAETKQDIRVQARRAGTDAEIAQFRSRGYAKLIWIAPNGVVACPDCRLRQNVSLTMEQWEEKGRPGSGLTICGASCFCMLLPVEVNTVSPSLLTRHTTSKIGPMTDESLLAFLNAHRIPAKSS